MIKKYFKIIVITILSLVVLGILFYIKIIPVLVQNNFIISQTEKIASKVTKSEVKIVNPILKTNFSSNIGFSIKKISIKKDNTYILNIENLDTNFSFKKIFSKVIIINKFGIDNIFIDANKLMELVPSDNTASNTSDNNWKINIFNAVLYLNKCMMVYEFAPDTVIELNAEKLFVDNREKEERFVHFNLNTDITKKENNVHIAIADDNKVVIRNKHLYIDNCPLIINKSTIFFNARAGRDTGYILEVFANKFYIKDIIDLLQTNIMENNIDETLEYIKDLKGNFDFKFKLTKEDLDGKIKFNKIAGKLTALNNIPFEINSGDISLNAKDMKLTNFKGWYNNNKINTFDFGGRINDYAKTMDMEIIINSKITNEFMKDYLSKTAGLSLELIGTSQSKIILKSLNNIFDITMMGKLAKGNDILVEGTSLTPTKFDRAYKTDLHLNGNNLNIETINYYIAKEITKATKGITPILTINGNINLPDGAIIDLGFDIPNPLPSEFLNVLIGQRLFRKGTFSGNLHYWNKNNVPKISGNIKAEKIRIPSQRLFLREGNINTDIDLIKVKAKGKYKRCSFDFSGSILNEIIFPIIIKNTTLTLDNIDVDRIMRTMNAPVQSTQDAQKAYTNYSGNDDNEDMDISDDDVAQTFDLKNIIIEECIVNIIKGKYKDILFSNIKAKMSLDKNSVFKMHSNRFDIAEGISSVAVNCDIPAQKYHLVLGIKDVNSDIMSTSILNLPKEISGKASGIIDLNTDESLKLNGMIKFNVKNGSIPKVGLLEYVFKFASLFRNPIAMISPSTLSDLVNIPEGNFDWIKGDLKLKDNKIELMKIKSYSPQLSSYIIGCYDLENSDAILRIYTKFSNKNKGFAGILRNISLNSLANRIPTKNRNDINYYAAELAQLPKIDADEKDCQIFLTKVDGDLEHNNFLSSLKKIK